MAGLIYILIVRGSTALLKKKRSEVYLAIISFNIWLKQKISFLREIKVCLKCILILLKPKDFFTVSNIFGLKVAE